MHEVTKILNELSEMGDSRATEKLVSQVYAELRSMAQAKMANERLGHSLDATALVHEAYLRLAGADAKWENRRHFFGAAAEAMRRILIDRARKRSTQKRGREKVPLEFVEGQLVDTEDPKWMLLSEAIDEFQLQEPEKAELVKLRYFAGLTIKQTADVLGISTASADRHWAYSRAWLQAYVSDEGSLAAQSNAAEGSKPQT